MRRHAGFTWIELVLVIAVIGILAAMAIPGMQERALRKQIKEALALADVAKAGVQAIWGAGGQMPADNKAAGVPDAEKIVGNFVAGVNVDEGAVTLTLGNNASKHLHGKKVTLRPAVVPDQLVVPIAWVCHNMAVPKGMEVRGRNDTDVPTQWLPVECRGAEEGK